MADVRKKVFLSLLGMAENARFSNLEADAALSRSDFSISEKAFYSALFYGVIERQITLDYQIYKLTGKGSDKLQEKVLILLRMGLYQLLFMNTADHAAVSETVKLAKETVNPGAVGFINGVLRQAGRKLKNEAGETVLITPDKTRDVCGYLSITYSYPRYLCKMWVSAYGEENAEKIMIAENSRPGATLRVNTLKTTRDELLSKLTEAGFKAQKSEITGDGIVLSEGNVTEAPGFAEGEFFVQDDASALCVCALDPKPGETLIDACACPGGKSFLSAIKMKNEGKIISFDIHESKLSLITDGAARLGLSIIEARQGDSSVFDESLSGIADRVLCDVPCSGFGTISRKPDLRLKNKESVSALPALQLSILKNCSSYVKHGGTLVYSTCTLCPDENENNVRAFLTLSPEFSLEKTHTNFPFESRSDGFFYAVMKRK